ncbi:T9SS type A sorting domain-containing protein [Chryseobacterium cucumeris]|uniref:T9SS type A sorting domain-containing protein n=1 Tax=Chryseobacterium cucumeris TaxID=1813611 RepID=UPI002455FD62|nr:T9SS type A sorting domain-containing protein [Chryseobacterium cucumeris]MDH5034850.1 T9SS type A sorting domain-containing protein [Chryseobacterium cucumeris]
MERISIYCIILSVFSIPILHAQAVVLAAGLDASAANGFVSYSVGQTTYLEKGTGQVLEGVQQPYEIITLTTFENSSELTGILLYPNPFRDYLYLDFTSNNFKGSEYQLFDAQGKLVKKDKISQSKSELNFSSIPSAMYIIRITQNGENIKTFKIIKK